MLRVMILAVLTGIVVGVLGGGVLNLTGSVAASPFLIGAGIGLLSAIIVIFLIRKTNKNRR